MMSYVSWYTFCTDEDPTMILSARSSDNSSKGLTDWPFMSVQQMGENPAGTWSVRIIDTVSI